MAELAMMDPRGMNLWDEEPKLNSPVADYYRDKVVLLTGATGFLGKLYMSKLARCGVRELIVIVREKKGIQPKERIARMIEKEGVLQVFRNNVDNCQQRITVIRGDVEADAVGMGDEDVAYVRERTEIVLHAAADVKFDQSLSRIIVTNVKGTMEMLNLCVGMEKLELLIYISTAYANCIHMTAYERFYDPPMDPLKMLELMKHVNEEQAQFLTPMIIRPWPNSYTYVKALAEHLVRMYFDRLKIVIIRPSIVASTMYDPVQGWTDNLYGLNGVIVGAGCGILRVLHAIDEMRCDVIPADFVINGTLVAAHQAAESYKSESPSADPDKVHIYHLASGTDNPLTNKDVQDLTKTIGTEYHPYKSLWIGTYVSTRLKSIAWILTMIMHFVPGVIVDALQRFRGKKPVLMKIYRKVRKFTDFIDFFMCQQFTFDNRKMRHVFDQMTPGDKALFQCDMKTITWQDYFNIYYPGLKMYLLNEPPNTWIKAQDRYDRLCKITKYTCYALVMIIVYCGADKLSTTLNPFLYQWV